ncbi:MAG: hypothetical protein K2J14_04685, partial [Treponemataceae bacterium]|nr:hypothetical protein [Treponemataceae bacterium]
YFTRSNFFSIMSDCFCSKSKPTAVYVLFMATPYQQTLDFRIVRRHPALSDYYTPLCRKRQKFCCAAMRRTKKGHRAVSFFCC